MGLISLDSHVIKKGQDTNRERAFMKMSDWDDMMMVIHGMTIPMISKES